MKFVPAFLLLSLFYACAPKPIVTKPTAYESKIDKMTKVLEIEPPVIISDSSKTPGLQYTSPNFGMRRPNFVIIHHTAQNSCDETLRAFGDSLREVSAHYLICRDGTIHHLVSDYLRAWHAGNSKWGSLTDLNSSSIGIELDNNGFEPFPEAQITALMGLLPALKDTFKIPVANFIGHADIAPGRKNDPSVFFPWKKLADNGFGKWYSDTATTLVPPNFDPLVALRIIGYDISNPPAAFEAFRIHFLQQRSTNPLTEPEKKVLYNLMMRFL